MRELSVRIFRGRATIEALVGAWLIVIGAGPLAGFTDGNCDPIKAGLVPTTARACARSGGFWTPAVGAGHALYLGTQIAAHVAIVTGAVLAALACVELVRELIPHQPGSA